MANSDSISKKIGNGQKYLLVDLTIPNACILYKACGVNATLIEIRE
jgi:hypothetical protein